MFKIAYDAGHCLTTAGKRLPAQLDPNETREWVLNDRVARHFAAAAAEYEGVELLRVDDPTGKTNVHLSTRCKRANDFGADFYLSIHHNAAQTIFSGGGIVAYSYTESKTGVPYRDAIYDACIEAGGIKGNRSTPKNTANFYIIKYTNMPAVLMEYGFMNSTVDYSIILKDEYSKLVAYATMAGIAKVKGLKKKTVNVTKPVTTTTTSTSNKNTYTHKDFVKDVQKAIGAKVDGIAGSETLSKTVTVSTIFNRKHAVVKPIQKWLYALGYVSVGTADGIAGSKFKQAVKEFQKDNNCTKDGIITKRNKTWRALLRMN